MAQSFNTRSNRPQLITHAARRHLEARLPVIDACLQVPGEPRSMIDRFPDGCETALDLTRFA